MQGVVLAFSIFGKKFYTEFYDKQQKIEYLNVLRFNQLYLSQFKAYKSTILPYLLKVI